MYRDQVNDLVKFCASCGTPLEWREFEHKQRPYCPRCQQVHYAQLKVGAGGLIEQDGRLLLLQRTQAPFEHCWNLPAGYAEINESPRQTVVREVYEETGLHVEVEGLIDVYFFADDPRGNGILIVYRCRSLGGKLAATAEAVNPTFFAASDIPRNLAGGGHDQAILAWQSSRRAGTSDEV
jgi:ADP-ribose pyrophosphatase YjhB (NUDIX family)